MGSFMVPLLSLNSKISGTKFKDFVLFQVALLSHNTIFRMKRFEYIKTVIFPEDTIVNVSKVLKRDHLCVKVRFVVLR